MLKKFDVEIEEINKYKLKLDAINKEEAKKAVIDIIKNTEILDMNLFEKKTLYKFNIVSSIENNDIKLYII